MQPVNLRGMNPDEYSKDKEREREDNRKAGLTTRGRFSNPEKKVEEENKSHFSLYKRKKYWRKRIALSTHPVSLTFFPRQREEDCCHELLSLPLDSTGLFIFSLSKESNEIFILRRLGFKTKMLPNKSSSSSSSQRLCSLSCFISSLGLRKKR